MLEGEDGTAKDETLKLVCGKKTDSERRKSIDVKFHRQLISKT